MPAVVETKVLLGHLLGLDPRGCVKHARMIPKLQSLGSMPSSPLTEYLCVSKIDGGKLDLGSRHRPKLNSL